MGFVRALFAVMAAGLRLRQNVEKACGHAMRFSRNDLPEIRNVGKSVERVCDDEVSATAPRREMPRKDLRPTHLKFT